MSRKRVKAFIILGIVGALTSAGIYLVSLSGSEIANEKKFLESYYSLVDATTGLTERYHKEIEKWEREQYDDHELANITNSFLSEYKHLVEEASSLNPPQKFQQALDFYIKSLNSERASYVAFRDFIETGDPKLNETSIDLLSNATRYELESFNLIESLR
ncbi:MAG TPA: hypothetical protein VE130_08165 [Nitrososphaeraceae archaeon]|nr:hypothetical protein [Nitrososphaeraceae archaeon]